ncbi:hypothetical protein TNCV_1322401 [Trichonephila clavipes]|nr:hypothetical protein TNCV_1322401 [Trichonephila clavipes]
MRRVGMSSQQPGQASGGILPKSHAQWFGESGKQSQLFQCLGIGPSDQSFPWLTKAVEFWGHGSMFVNECGNNTLCSFESKRTSG